jgi:hypothetical protein
MNINYKYFKLDMSAFTASNSGAYTTNYTNDTTFYFLGGAPFTGPPNWTSIVNNYTPVIPSTFTSDWIVLGTGGSGRILSVTFENVNSNNDVVVVLQSGGGTFTSGAGNMFSPPQMVCFLENSKIRTDKGYVPIQDLQKGDLVLTLKNEYKPVSLLGKKEIYHMASKERIKDQLYKLSSTEYPEIFEDLIITGAHCLLVDKFSSQKQQDDMLKVHGKIFVTDGKYRLPACADEKTTVYETAGTYTIYHLALENDDDGMNYGIYANGLLVETCSKRYLKDKSNMTLY